VIKGLLLLHCQTFVKHAYSFVKLVHLTARPSNCSPRRASNSCFRNRL